jgi:hypothetical protein
MGNIVKLKHSRVSGHDDRMSFVTQVGVDFSLHKSQISERQLESYSIAKKWSILIKSILE